jgi:hypothetical protein
MVGEAVVPAPFKVIAAESAVPAVTAAFKNVTVVSVLELV